MAGKRAHSFLCSLLVCYGLHIKFSKSDLHLTETFLFLGLCLDTVHMSVSLPCDKLGDTEHFTLSLLWVQTVTICQIMSFLGNQFLCQWPLTTVAIVSCHQGDMLTVYHSPTHLFSSVHFSFSALHELEWLSHLQQSLVPLQFPIPNVAMVTYAMPSQLVSGFWSAIISQWILVRFYV